MIATIVVIIGIACVVVCAAVVIACCCAIGAGESDPECDAGVNTCCQICGRHVCGPKTGEPQYTV